MYMSITEWYEVLLPESIYLSVFNHYSYDYVLNIMYDISLPSYSWLLGLNILWALDKSSRGKMALYFVFISWLSEW